MRAVTKQVNGTWQVVARHDFMPFGEEVAPPIPPQDKRLFTGKERDSETGLDYFGARYYRADVGRFTTVDPELRIKDALVDPQKWNRYAYVQNNPLRYVDPDGRYGIDVHYYSTFALAYAAGYRSDDSANRIARADLSVDIEHDPRPGFRDRAASGTFLTRSARRGGGDVRGSSVRHRSGHQLTCLSGLVQPRWLWG